MHMTSGILIAIPFAICFAIPGILLAKLALGKRPADASLFIIYASIFGLFSQFIIGSLASISARIPVSPATKISLISATVIMGLVWHAMRRAGASSIAFGRNDFGAILVATLVMLGVALKIAGLPQPYFNPATDQYYWFSYAEQSLHDPSFVMRQTLTTELHRPLFFLSLGPHIAYLPKETGSYQKLIATWSCLYYWLIALAIARLARTAVSSKALALLAAPMLFSLHWFNYYLISTALVPQNIGLFIMVSCFVIMAEHAPLAIAWTALAMLYVMHLGTLAIFLISVGTGAIWNAGIAQCTRWIGRTSERPAWNLYERIAFLPAFAVIILYAAYALNLLSYFNPRRIAYYAEYMKSLSLTSQPYMGKIQEIVMWAGALGAGIGVALRKNIPLAATFVVAYAFLMTPLIAYHAFYASWQSFRYYLFLYPSIVILALWLADRCIALIGRMAGREAKASAAFISIIVMFPAFSGAAFDQQNMVFLDMIVGRDDGVRNKELTERIEELVEFRRASAEGGGPIVMLDRDRSIPTYASWAFAPRRVFHSDARCTERACPVQDILTGETHDLFEIDAYAVIVPKYAKDGDPGISTEFPLRRESASFIWHSRS